MSVTVIAEFPVKEEKVEELKGLIKQVLPDTRAYDGCQGVDVKQDQDNKGTLVLLETWATRGQYEKYLAWRTETGLMEALGPFLAGAPSIRYFDAVDA